MLNVSLKTKIEGNAVVNSFMNEEEKEINVKYKAKFIDSLSFLASSIESLTENLKKSGQKLSNYKSIL